MSTQQMHTHMLLKQKMLKKIIWRKIIFIPAEGEHGEDHEGVGDDDDEESELKEIIYTFFFKKIFFLSVCQIVCLVDPLRAVVGRLVIVEVWLGAAAIKQTRMSSR